MRKTGLLLVCLLLLLSSCAPEQAAEIGGPPEAQTRQTADVGDGETQSEAMEPPLTEKQYRQLEEAYLQQLFPESFTPELEVAELVPAMHTVPPVTVADSVPPVAGFVPGFDGSLYRCENLRYVHSADAIFFLKSNFIYNTHSPTGLYYYREDGGIVLLLESVTELCAVDRQGIYLVQAASTEHWPGRTEHAGIAVSRLLYYTPGNGGTEVVRENVLTAYFVPESPVVYYVDAALHPLEESDQFNRNYILSLHRWNRETGEDLVLFTDGGMKQSASYPVWYAFDAYFAGDGEALALTLYYPYESMVPAWRSLELDPDSGEILVDNNPYELTFDRLAAQSEAAAQTSAESTAFVYRDPIEQVNNSIATQLIAFDGFEIAEEASEKYGGDRANYYLQQGQERVYLGTGRIEHALSLESCFAFRGNGQYWLYPGGETIYTMGGNWDEVYLPYRPPVSVPDPILRDRDRLENCYALRAVADSVQLILLYEILSYGATLEQNEMAKRTHLAGNFIIDEVTGGDCIVVCHIPTGSVGVMNGDGMEIIAAVD